LRRESAMPKFRFQQITPRGLWTSPGVFEAEYDEIVEMVHGAHAPGQPRAAVEADSARVIYALDAQGNPTDAAAQLFAASPTKAA